jgi:hypothetical protein
VVRALYGLRSSAAAFRSHLASTLTELGYLPSKGDPDVYYKEKYADRTYLYEYIITYVDDIMLLSKDEDNNTKSTGQKTNGLCFSIHRFSQGLLFARTPKH